VLQATHARAAPQGHFPARALAALLAAFAAGCAAPQDRCGPQEQLAVSDTLFFGTATSEGVVSAQDWTSFLAGTVTPQFPAGLTAWPASGQWQSADGGLTQENSYVLNIVHPPGAAADAAIRSIMTQYRARFRQQAVLRVRTPACTSF
jgi:hypothetical protein